MKAAGSEEAEEEARWVAGQAHSDPGYHVQVFKPPREGQGYDPDRPGVDQTGVMTYEHLRNMELARGRLLVAREGMDGPHRQARELLPFSAGLTDKHFPLLILHCSGHLRDAVGVDRLRVLLDRAIARAESEGTRLDLVIDTKKMSGAQYNPLLDVFYHLCRFDDTAMPRVERAFRRVCLLCDRCLKPDLVRVLPVRWPGYHPDGFRFGVYTDNKAVDRFMRLPLKPPATWLDWLEKRKRERGQERQEQEGRVEISMDTATTDALVRMLGRLKERNPN
jgi:hypothetical protein